MKHILKYQLLVLILCLAAASSQSKALVISSDKTLVAKKDSLVNMSTAQGIEKIWLEDCRPDSNVVILSWIGSDLSDTINCRIQRWEKKEGPINFKILNVQVVKNQDQYEFRDREIKSDIDYRYKIWILLKDGYSISPEVSTVKPISITKWGDCSKKQPDSSVLVYVNGLNDVVMASRFNEDMWEAVSFQFALKVNNQTLEHGWQASNLDIFSPKNHLENLADNDICYYRVRGKDKEGNICRWSDWEFAILDISPPSETEYFDVKAELNAASTDGWMKLRWSKAKDNLSGVSHYQLLRKSSPDSQFKEIENARNLTRTSFDDPFVDIDTSTTVFYQLRAVDSVGNEGIVGLKSTRCLLGPKIELIAVKKINNNKYILDDSFSINCPDYDIINLVGFIIKINNAIMPPIETDKIPLINYGISKFAADTLFIQVQALFEDFQHPLITTWSNIDSVIRVKNPPLPVTDLTVTNNLPNWAENEYKQRDGNLYLQWTRPSEQIVGYEIWRWDEAGVSSLIGVVDTSSTDTIRWVDRYDYDELNDIEGDTLFVFRYYTYGVKAINFFDIPSEFSNFDSDYCNRAPEIKQVKVIDYNNVCIKWLPVHSDIKIYPLNCQTYYIHIFNEYYDTTKTKHGCDSIRVWLPDRKRKYNLELVGAITPVNSSEIKTACSEIFLIEPRLCIPPVQSLELQPQPGDSGIFVSWESYWDSLIWINNNLPYSPGMVDSFVVSRMIKAQNGGWIDDYKYGFEKGTPEWTNAQFMDQTTLIDSARYKYTVFPYQTTFDGCATPDIDFPTEEIHDTGRVFIPQLIDTIYFRNDQNQLYFDGTVNKIAACWHWIDRNNRQPTLDDFQGCNSIWIEVSNNSNFDSGMNYLKTIRDTLYLNHEQPFLESNFIIYFNNLSSNLQIGSNETIFLRVSGFDKWQNQHDYWATDFGDTIVKVINDFYPPGRPELNRNFTVRAPDSSEHSKVIVKLAWRRSTDIESGLKNYWLKRQLAADKTLVEGPIYIEPNVVNYEYKVDLSQIDKITKYQYIMTAEDWVEHKVDCENPLLWNAISAPQNFKIDTIPNEPYKMKVYWSPISGVTGYFIEWHSDIKRLGKNRYIDPKRYLVVTPDTSSSAIIEVDSTMPMHFFWIHVLAFDGSYVVLNDSIFELDGNEGPWTAPLRFKTPQPNFIEQFTNITSNGEVNIPSNFCMYQNFPNPFNSSTKIKYDVPVETHVVINIFDLLGRKIVTLVNDDFSPGGYEVCWDGSNYIGEKVPSGIYFYHFRTQHYTQVKKCLLLY